MTEKEMVKKIREVLVMPHNCALCSMFSCSEDADKIEQIREIVKEAQ